MDNIYSKVFNQLSFPSDDISSILDYYQIIEISNNSSTITLLILLPEDLVISEEEKNKVTTDLIKELTTLLKVDIKFDIEYVSEYPKIKFL